MKKVLALAAALALSVSAGAQAAQCRDASGKFIKCAAEKPVKQVCKDASGKFAKCGSPGAKPVK